MLAMSRAAFVLSFLGIICSTIVLVLALLVWYATHSDQTPT